MKQAGLGLGLIVLFFLPTVSASIGIGVEPTIAGITLSNHQPQQILRVKIYDESTTPANYTFNITDDIKNYLVWECGSLPYWCLNKSYIIPAGTLRANAMTVDFFFMKKTNETIQKNFTITVRAQPMLNQTGMVGVIPQVTIDVHLTQTNETITTTTSTTTSTTTTTPSTTATTTTSGGGSSGTTTSTTTTTTTITRTTTSTIRPTPTTTIGNTTTATVPTTTTQKQNSILSSIPTTYQIIIAVVAVVAITGFFIWRLRKSSSAINDGKDIFR